MTIINDDEQLVEHLIDLTKEGKLHWLQDSNEEADEYYVMYTKGEHNSVIDSPVAKLTLIPSFNNLAIEETLETGLKAEYFHEIDKELFTELYELVQNAN